MTDFNSLLSETDKSCILKIRKDREDLNQTFDLGDVIDFVPVDKEYAFFFKNTWNICPVSKLTPNYMEDKKMVLQKTSKNLHHEDYFHRPQRTEF